MAMDTSVLFTMGGDASEAVAALTELDDLLTSLQEHFGALFDATSSLDSVTGSLDTLTESAAGADAAAATLAEGLASAGADADTAAQSMVTLQGSMDALSASIEANTAALTANTAAKEANAAATGANAAAHDAAGASWMAAGSKLGMVAMGAGVAALAFGYFGMQAQDALNRVAALTGASASQMALYTAGAQALSQQMGSSLKATADGLYYVVSAGFQGQDALNVLKIAMMDAAAGGSDMATTADGLTTALNAFGASANQAQHYSDIMIQAVTYGKQTFQNFASSISMAAVAGHQAGFSFAEVAAAEATMTQSGVSAHRATMELRFLFNAIGLSVDTVAKRAQALGLAFDANAYSAMNLDQRLHYLRQIAGSNNSAFETLVGGTNGLTAANILLNKRAGDTITTYQRVMNAMAQASQGAGATSTAFATHTQTLHYHLDQLGAALSVLAYKIVQLATPAVGAVFDTLTHALTGFMSFLQQHSALVMPLLIALASVLGGVLVLAISAFVGTMVTAMATAAPVVAVLAAIIAGAALLALGVKQLVEHFAPFRAAVQAAGEQLRSVAQSVLPQLKLAWSELEPALVKLLPALKVIGLVLGVVLVGAIGVLVGLISGLANAFSSMTEGLAEAFAGITSVIGGFLGLQGDLFGGFFQLLGDLLHGNFSKFGSDLRAILGKLGADVMNILGGLWHLLEGLTKATLGTLLSFIGNFIGGILGFFGSLFDKLVGHSIIPDLMDKIVGFFLGLPGRVFGALASFMIKLPAQFLQLGLNLADALKQGIEKAAQAAIQGVENLGHNLIGGLQHVLGIASPSRVFAEMGAQTALGFTQGLLSQQAAINEAVGAFRPPSGGAGGAASLGLVTAAAAAARGGAGGFGVGGGGSGAEVATTHALLGQLIGAVRALGAGGGSGVAGAGAALAGATGTTVHEGARTTHIYGVPGAAMAQIAADAQRRANDAGNAMWRRPGGFRRPGPH